MTVKQFLNKMMIGCSTIESVSLRMNLVEVKRLSKTMIINDEYFGFGNDKILSFEIHGDSMILNLKKTI